MARKRKDPVLVLTEAVGGGGYEIREIHNSTQHLPGDHLKSDQVSRYINEGWTVKVKPKGY